jgi:copper chaperone CopZ
MTRYYKTAAISLFLLALAGNAAHRGAHAANVEPQSSAKHDATVHLAVQGMLTANCPVLLRKALKGVNGIHAVRASLKEKSAEVQFDRRRINVETIQSIIKDRVGFDTTVKKVESRGRATPTQQQHRSQGPTNAARNHALAADCGCQEPARI